MIHFCQNVQFSVTPKWNSRETIHEVITSRCSAFYSIVRSKIKSAQCSMKVKVNFEWMQQQPQQQKIRPLCIRKSSVKFCEWIIAVLWLISRIYRHIVCKLNKSERHYLISVFVLCVLCFEHKENQIFSLTKNAARKVVSIRWFPFSAMNNINLLQIIVRGLKIVCGTTMINIQDRYKLAMKYTIIWLPFRR